MMPVNVHTNAAAKHVSPITWGEFRKTGLLRFINTFLHIFGMCIVLEADDEGKVTSAYPARCSYDGFSKGDEQNFARLRQFMDTDKFFRDNNKRKIGG